MTYDEITLSENLLVSLALVFLEAALASSSASSMAARTAELPRFFASSRLKSIMYQLKQLQSILNPIRAHSFVATLLMEY